MKTEISVQYVDHNRLAMAGEPFFTPMPQIWGVKPTGQLPDWVSAKDVILENAAPPRR